MQSHTLEYIVDATPEQIWRTLHPPRPPSEGPRVIEYAGGRIEIIQEGDETGKGLVRHCTFRVPRWLLSGGIGRSWECVTESRENEYSHYMAVGKPLWSRAEGWYELTPLDGDRTRLVFGETYEAFNPVMRWTLEGPVHRAISRDNDQFFRQAVERCGRVTLVGHG